MPTSLWTFHLLKEPLSFFFRSRSMLRTHVRKADLCPAVPLEIRQGSGAKKLHTDNHICEQLWRSAPAHAFSLFFNSVFSPPPLSAGSFCLMGTRQTTQLLLRSLSAGLVIFKIQIYMWSCMKTWKGIKSVCLLVCYSRRETWIKAQPYPGHVDMTQRWVRGAAPL